MNIEMTSIIIGLLSGGVAIFGNGFIQFLIQRKDNKNDHFKTLEEKIEALNQKIDKIREEQIKAEKDSLRTQLLVMIFLKPDSEQEIMKLAERYFKELHGDWFYTSLFKKWLVDRHLEKPIWFDENK